MAKTWYPVIDYSACIECGTCVVKCPHGVYDTAKAPAPVVAEPEACIDHCHGCGNRCPVGAISYVGEDTGWTPPNGKQEPAEACCSCGSECECDGSVKKVIVDYLYLDLNTCDRCIGTDIVLDEVMMALTPALQLAGYEVEYNKIKMETAELAKKYKFLSSPTIRVNGRDICASVAENSCGCCGEISGTDVNCRVFEYNGEDYEIPPKEMLAEAILHAVFGNIESGCSCGGYELPDNLRKFYEGIEKKPGCSCGGDCCGGKI
jgi:NAD-dependent dihydropyrimidine dehydrogenase PreA subunit